MLFDGVGDISGEAGSVLVGGEEGGEGYIRAIHSDGTQTSIIGPGSGMVNPNALRFDSTGRLVMADNVGKVFAYDGINPTVELFTLPDRNGSLAIDSSDRIYTAAIDGVVRIHDAAGNLRRRGARAVVARAVGGRGGGDGGVAAEASIPPRSL